MIMQIQHSKLDATNIDTESAIFAHVMNLIETYKWILRHDIDAFRDAT